MKTTPKPTSEGMVRFETTSSRVGFEVIKDLNTTGSFLSDREKLFIPHINASRRVTEAYTKTMPNTNPKQEKK